MSQKLIIAFDVGTTFSGVSYAFQDGTNQPPEIHGVTRLPGRFPGFMGADSKIPSQVVYLQTPAVVPYSFGSEVDEFEQAASEDPILVRRDYIKVQWFKILLRPGQLSPPAEIRTQLPVEINAIQVFADYLRYLYGCTMDYIKETHVNSAHLLQTIGTNIHFVLTHPNGWNGPQQARIRTAAVKAGLVTRSSDNRLHLLTEGEASINFCVEQGLTQDIISPTEGVAVIDAGGGTIDISAYRRSSRTASGTQDQRIKLEEIIDARFNAGVHFRYVECRKIPQRWAYQLVNSKFKGEIENIAREFDRMAKLRFRSPESSQFIKFGKMGDTEKEFNISNGKIEISGKELAKFFEPSIDAIVESFKDIKGSSQATVTRALLVGGFAGSQYLYTELKKRLAPLEIELYRPDRHLNKAVANGAIAHFLNRTVVARVSKYTLGSTCFVRYDDTNEEHRKRFQKSWVSRTDGHRKLEIFQPIIAKGTSVKDNGDVSEYTEYICQQAKDGQFRPILSSPILVYRGNLPGTADQWMDEEPDKYEKLCDVKCHLSTRTLKELQDLPKHKGLNGTQYTKCDWYVSLVLGGPEMSAHVVLRYKPLSKKNHVKIKSKSEIVYFDRDDDGEINQEGDGEHQED